MLKPFCDRDVPLKIVAHQHSANINPLHKTFTIVYNYSNGKFTGKTNDSIKVNNHKCFTNPHHQKADHYCNIWNDRVRVT